MGRSGRLTEERVSYSYSDSEVSAPFSVVGKSIGSTTDSTAVAYPTAVLQQMPTSATGIYEPWGTEAWDFGTSMQYPALKVDFHQDGSVEDDLSRQR